MADSMDPSATTTVASDAQPASASTNAGNTIKSEPAESETLSHSAAAETKPGADAQPKSEPADAADAADAAAAGLPDDATLRAAIADILAASDLDSVSSRAIRKQLEQQFGVKLGSQKDAIDQIIMEIIMSAEPAEGAQDDDDDDGEQDQDDQEDQEDQDEDSEIAAPAKAGKKKAAKKRSHAESEQRGRADGSDVDGGEDEDKDEADQNEDDDDDDAKPAKRIRLDSDADGTPTRSGSRRAASSSAKKSRAKGSGRHKSAETVDSSDDESSASSKPAAKRKSTATKARASSADSPQRARGWAASNKDMELSPALAALVGAPQMARPKVVSKIWEIVKAENLQDPDDRRYIRCNDAMKAVFGSARVHMFSMNKVLSDHIFKNGETTSTKSRVKEEESNDDEDDEDDDDAEAKPAAPKPKPKAPAAKSASPKRAPAAKPAKPVAALTRPLTDEELARQLQAEVNGGRQRRAAAPLPRKPAAEGKSRGGGGGFSKPVGVSPELAALLGASELPRSQVIKKLWVIIKERNLQDPTNKQFILCDPQLEAIIGKPRVQMFKMTREIERHIHPLSKEAIAAYRAKAEANPTTDGAPDDDDAPEGDGLDESADGPTAATAMDTQ
ncbi:hypothetical protein CAOG_09088 [Capsaspora owczarzaki ATCC 30864]|uniref:DM2 domain-containing protein n=1 Tax=Capsaspora owczarzaki (strain ATCC 30864) TaxID=595528 RepID=A0A0D2W085_CAPO3|nr:hypothetical protein CAOG_09088 [Capsaspora owczarzaki ATCC 30864]KJE97582.1 hypothetical protein CAOG_009088 [Capsaspora owczarzaki ATCC 30864]|eukprot:XP_011270821.1 hypothetical protein CAOG_09088 [Capsaspora owczarzaki ATCC 30864]